MIDYKFSIITPEHSPKNMPFLYELYETIKNQTHKNWEWILYLNGECKLPSKDNPFMNTEIYDYNTKNVETPACNSYNNKGVQSYSDKLFSSSLIRDVNDLFGKNNSQRQFYTVPGNSIPNDQDTFSKWLYATPKTCKEGNGLQCAANMYGVNKGPLGD